MTTTKTYRVEQLQVVEDDEGAVVKIGNVPFNSNATLYLSDLADEYEEVHVEPPLYSIILVPGPGHKIAWQRFSDGWYSAGNKNGLTWAALIASFTIDDGGFQYEIAWQADASV